MVCRRPIHLRAFLCRLCQRSYDRHLERGGSLVDVIAWAARRARRAVESGWGAMPQWYAPEEDT